MSRNRAEHAISKSSPRFPGESRDLSFHHSELLEAIAIPCQARMGSCRGTIGPGLRRGGVKISARVRREAGPATVTDHHLCEFTKYILRYRQRCVTMTIVEVMTSPVRDRTRRSPQSAGISTGRRCFLALTDVKHPGFLRSTRSRWLKIVWKNSKNSEGGRL
jgi:hypothetical protein